jgi:nitrous oxide reductase accessory protein NosL
VTGYYDQKPIAASAAFFVKGSDVYGPMGHELVAFVSEEESQEFLQDHAGEEILRLDVITPDVIAELD